MRYLTALIALLMLAGCASTRRAVNTYQMQQDSTYNSVRRLDSLFRVMMQRDSTYRRDSIYIWEKGDTVTKYVERTKYRIVTRTDTLYRDRLRTDTLYINRTDSVTVEKPVYIEKQMNGTIRALSGLAVCAVWLLSFGFYSYI